MRWPRFRLTVARMMIVIALLPATWVAFDRLSGTAARRAQLRGLAAECRWKAGWLRQSAARFRQCKTGHRRGVRVTECPICEEAWRGSFLNFDINDPTVAVVELDRAVAILERYARDRERESRRVWSPGGSNSGEAAYEFWALQAFGRPLHNGFWKAY